MQQQTSKPLTISQIGATLDALGSLNPGDKEKLFRDAVAKRNAAQAHVVYLGSVFNMTDAGLGTKVHPEPQMPVAVPTVPKKKPTHKPAKKATATTTTKKAGKKKRKSPESLREEDLSAIEQAVKDGVNTKRALVARFKSTFGDDMAGQQRLDMHIRRLSRENKMYFQGTGEQGKWVHGPDPSRRG